MGFDLYSIGNPKSEKGEYFRNNVWWWRRLADYVITKTGVVDDKDADRWHYNDNHEVSKEEALQIANQLRHLIKTGDVDEYAKEVQRQMEIAEKHNARVDKLRDQISKQAEKELGKTDVAPVEYPEKYKKKWDKLFQLKDWNDSYPFTRKNVEEFIEFCEDSNGFTIG